MSRSKSPEASLAAATSRAWRPLAAVSSRSVDSHVNPSPRVCHSMPRWSASLRSPVFHFPPLMNWTTPTRQPRAQPRAITPKAADDFPLPCPVLRRTTESTRVTPAEASAAGVPAWRSVTPITFAHRGGRADAPQHTLTAFRRALGVGATGLESDARLAADGEVVLVHGSTVRTGLRRAKVRHLPADRLSEPGVPRLTHPH